MAKKKPNAAGVEAGEGMVMLECPEGGTGCSWDGQEYDAEEGIVTVPAEAAAELISHGFKVL